VPFVFSGPGIKPGAACWEPASLLDIYPTLVKLCSLPANKRLEGLSLNPQIDDPATPRKHPAIISSYQGNHAVRSRDWRLISYADGTEELYHHKVDQDEFKNLAKDPKYKSVRDELAPKSGSGSQDGEQVRTPARAARKRSSQFASILSFHNMNLTETIEPDDCHPFRDGRVRLACAHVASCGA